MADAEIDLGAAERVDVRSIWPHESVHFSAWLEKNLDRLSKALGVELEFVNREASVGDFWVDLLARDLSRNRPAIIENQLERRDHDHLGKLITYASGIDAALEIRISPEFRDEHRSRWIG